MNDDLQFMQLSSHRFGVNHLVVHEFVYNEFLKTDILRLILRGKSSPEFF